MSEYQLWTRQDLFMYQTGLVQLFMSNRTYDEAVSDYIPGRTPPPSVWEKILVLIENMILRYLESRQ